MYSPFIEFINFTYIIVIKNAPGITPQNFKKDMVSVPIKGITIPSFRALVKFCMLKIQNMSKVIVKNLGSSLYSIGQM